MSLRSLRLVCAAVGTAVAALGAPAHAQHQTNAVFDTTVARPALLKRRPRVLFDGAHNNVFARTGRSVPLMQLLRADGAMVEEGADAFTSGLLARYDVLVVLTAMGDPQQDSDAAQRPAFSEEEVEAVHTWVNGGGSLLLCLDHRPFVESGRRLAERFGVRVYAGYVGDSATSDGWAKDTKTPVYTRANAGLLDHPITRGRDSSERLNRVAVFGGESMTGPVGTGLLRVSRTARNIGEGNESGAPLGEAQAVALTVGRGRAVVTADCSLWTAQVVQNAVWNGPFGMARRDFDDRQFALNTVRWLSRVLR